MPPINCPCGAFFEGPACPVCGKPSGAPEPEIRILSIEDAPPPAAAPRAAARPGGPPARPAECGRHPGARAVARCSVCKAPLCAECRTAFGYFCSPEHKAGAPPPEASPDRQEYERAAAGSRKQLKIAGIAAVALVLALVVYFVIQGLVVTSGEVRWEAEFKTEQVTGLAAVTDGVRAITLSGKLIAFDAAGRRTAEQPIALNPGPGGFGAVVGDFGIVSQGGKTSAVSLRDGKLAWSCPGDATRAVPGSRLVTDGERVFLISLIRGKSGPSKAHLVCVEAKTGKEAWSVPFEDAAWGAQMAVCGGAVVARTVPPEGRFMDAPEMTALVVFAAADGKLMWRTPSDVYVRTPPVATARGVVLATPAGLQCFGAKDGSTLWTAALSRAGGPAKAEGEDPLSRPIKNIWPLGDALLLHVGRGLISLGLSDGKVRWTADAGMWIQSFVEQGGVLVAAGYTEEQLSKAFKDSRMVPDDPRLTAMMGSEGPRGKGVVPFLAGFDLKTGQFLWGLPASGKLLKTEHGVLAYGTQTGMGLVKTGEGGGQSVFTLLDPATGAVRWEYRHPGGVQWPTLAGETIVFATMKGRESRLVAVKMR